MVIKMNCNKKISKNHKNKTNKKIHLREMDLKKQIKYAVGRNLNTCFK